MNPFNTPKLAQNLDQNSDWDPIRKKYRVEINASVVLAAKDKQLVKKHADIILQKQSKEGFWLEYSYERDEESVGYFGAVPTSFCIMALLRAYKTLNQSEYLNAAINACDYLYAKEKNGYFWKAAMNKSNVLNTNLLAGAALLEASKTMNQKSRRVPIYRSACIRAIKRSLNSQHANGAYPYTSFGFTIPLLYHSMTLALLINLSTEFKDSLLDYSIKKGMRYLLRFVKKSGQMDWKQEQFPEKSGACWTYAWNYAIFESLGLLKKLKATAKHLNKLKGVQFFYEGDFNKKEDPFYTSWCLLALMFPKKKKLDITFFGSLRFYFSRFVFLPKKSFLICRIMKRKLFSFGLDKGPIEYW